MANIRTEKGNHKQLVPLKSYSFNKSDYENYEDRDLYV